ncbi:YbaN family protein [Chloroflexota bacterium]
MQDKLKKRLLVVAGIIFTGVGILGVFVPILPTTPFLLLAAACYVRSSQRFYNWLLNNKLLGLYISNYIQGKGMPLRVKIFTVILLWVSIGLSMWLATQDVVIRVILVLVAVGVTTHIVLIKKYEKTKDR